MIIVVDGMGGDNSPKAVVEGCILAQKEYGVDIIITGQEEVIIKELQNYEYDKDKIKILNAREVITPDEHPAMAIRKKKDSSLSKALYLVKNGGADAIVSAGSTGAFLTGATLIIGRIKGIDRPAFAPVMPGKTGPFMVTDCGANVDCKPKNLLQFAIMGKVFFEKALGVINPKVGLVNIGVEEEKGNELTKTTYGLLKELDLNFIGNVEPRDIPSGDVQVLICDGFVGNTILKMYEGVASSLLGILKEQILTSFRYKMGALLLKPMFKKIKKDFDYKEYGGAAFLGVKSICVKAHGSSDAIAFKNAIKQAKFYYDNDIINNIKKELEHINIDELIK